MFGNIGFARIYCSGVTISAAMQTGVIMAYILTHDTAAFLALRRVFFIRGPDAE